MDMITDTSHKPILICYDGSEDAQRAIEFIGAAFPHRNAILFTAWEPCSQPVLRSASELWPAGNDLPMMQVAERVAAEGCHRARRAGLSPVPLVVETLCGVTPAILEAAEEHDVALIAMGTRGLSAPRSRRLGPVSLDMAQHTDRPVVVVPPAPLGATQGHPGLD